MNRRFLVAAMAATTAIVAGPLAAAAESTAAQSVVALGAQVAYGVAVGPLANGNVFEAVLVAPGAAVGGPASNGVDMTRPWIELREENAAGSGDVCQTVTNPTTWSIGGGQASFEATCADGSPYLSYRVQWLSAEQYSIGAMGLAMGGWRQEDWGAPGVSPASGTLSIDTGFQAWDVLRICGWTGKVTRCGDSWSPLTGTMGPGVAGEAYIWPAQLLISTATFGA